MPCTPVSTGLKQLIGTAVTVNSNNLLGLTIARKARNEIMGNTAVADKPVSKKASPKTSEKSPAHARAATFRVITKQGGKRLFTPVNKRAKKLALVTGESTLTSKNLKGIKAMGFRVLESPSLKKISL